MQRLEGQAATLARWLRQRPFVLLDGGLATALERRGHRLDDALWSARLLRDDPAAIVQVHRDYLDAGADCVITASYQATIEGWMAAGESRESAEQLLRESVALAREACEDFTASTPAAGPRLVAASIGPYGAYLADGSEYVGDYGAVGKAALGDFHRTRWEVLAECCDLFACETLPSAVEAEVLLELLRQSPGVGAWFSFSCRDGTRIADGTPLAECAALCAANERVLAVGVNCTAPRWIESLVREVRRGAPDLPVVVYPNSGEAYDAAAGSWRGQPGASTELAALAPGWWRAGARLIGGCCRTGPQDISALGRALEEAAARAAD